MWQYAIVAMMLELVSNAMSEKFESLRKRDGAVIEEDHTLILDRGGMEESEEIIIPVVLAQGLIDEDIKVATASAHPVQLKSLLDRDPGDALSHDEVGSVDNLRTGSISQELMPEQRHNLFFLEILVRNYWEEADVAFLVDSKTITHIFYPISIVEKKPSKVGMSEKDGQDNAICVLAISSIGEDLEPSSSLAQVADTLGELASTLVMFGASVDSIQLSLGKKRVLIFDSGGGRKAYQTFRPAVETNSIMTTSKEALTEISESIQGNILLFSLQSCNLLSLHQTHSHALLPFAYWCFYHDLEDKVNFKSGVLMRSQSPLRTLPPVSELPELIRAGKGSRRGEASKKKI